MPEFSSPLAKDVPLAGLTAAAGLVTRRSRAVSDYWRAALAAREPSEILGIQLGYCTQMLDDYAQALSETVAPFTEVAPEPASFLPAVVEPQPSESRPAAA